MHLLAIILSVLTSLCFWFWANQPIWTKGPFQATQFYHAQSFNKQLTSFVMTSGKWYLETRDSISGELLHTKDISLPESFTPLMSYPNPAAHQVEHPLIVIRGQFNSTGGAKYGMVVADTSTGKLLTPTPIQVNALAIPACYGARAVIPVMDAALFFEYGKEPLRVLAMRNSSAILLLEDNEHLLATDGDILQIVPWSTGWVKSIGVHQQKLMNFTRLTQLPGNYLLVSSYDLRSNIKLYVELWRWDGLTLEKLSKPITLTPDNTSIRHHATTQAEANVDRQGNIHLPTFVFHSWPAPYRLLLTWCSTQGWNVSKYIPQSPQTVKHVLNFKNELIARYDELASSDKPLSTGVALRYHPIEGMPRSYMIKAMRILPQWPNAMALGMIVYLLWYVYHRVRGGHAVPEYKSRSAEMHGRKSCDMEISTAS